jgi:NTP pyrophosphatase (non-canonical NTP hydrolase)
MKTSQYVKEALSTECDYGPVLLRVAKDPQLLRLLHALLLLSTEANELLNNFKAHLFYGKPLDLVNVDEECGDILWALAVLADFRGYRTLIQFQNKNIAKLKKRYPNKFTEQEAQVRDLKGERTVLEGSTE